MNKVNRFSFCILVAFIVLLFTNVQATEAQNLDTVVGNGTKANPYVIDVSGRSLKRITFKYETLPFHFIVPDGQEGTFEISYEGIERTVTFMLIESDNNSTSVLLDKDKYENTMNWQVGVDNRLNEGSAQSMPTYKITEELSYYSSAEMFGQSYDERS